jgi:hypothetical protein
MTRVATRPQSYAVEPLVMRALDKSACHVLVASAAGLRLILPVQSALRVGRGRHSGVRLLLIYGGGGASVTSFESGAFLPVSRKLPFEIAIADPKRFEQSRMAIDAVVVLVVRLRLLRRAVPLCARGQSIVGASGRGLKAAKVYGAKCAYLRFNPPAKIRRW